MNFSDLYRMHDADSAKCLQALRDGKPLEVTYSDDANPPRQAVIKTRLPLERALTQAKTIWQDQKKAAANGRCTMSPPMPPIAVIPPPSPPPRRAAP